jgi:hypothetical protein
MKNPGYNPSLHEKTIGEIEDAITMLELDLSGLTVLTEAASGNYLYTPFIAGLAKAEKVYAFTKDSIYGSSAAIKDETLKLAKKLNLSDVIEVRTQLTSSLIHGADIVTNLGSLRPIDKIFISQLKPTAVIPLMWETWEFRDGELDLQECWKNGIPVLGTNESDGRINTLSYLGPLTLKILYDNGEAVKNSRMLIINNNKFGPYIQKSLTDEGAIVEMIELNNPRDETNLDGLSFVVVNTWPSDIELFGVESVIKIQELKRRSSQVIVLNLTGKINRESLKKNGIKFLPEHSIKPGHMGWTLNELGSKPVIDLHCAGLKVGEIMARLRLGGYSMNDVIKNALNNSICQDFPREIKDRYLV